MNENLKSRIRGLLPKESFVPPESAGPAGGAMPPGMDPAAAMGGVPMPGPMSGPDPSMAAGGAPPPVDPMAMAGMMLGAPAPVAADPSMGVVPQPMDPNAMPPDGGMGSAMPPLLVSFEDLQALFQEIAGQMTGSTQGAEKPAGKPEGKKTTDERLTAIENTLQQMTGGAVPAATSPAVGAEGVSPEQVLAEGFTPDAQKTAEKEELDWTRELEEKDASVESAPAYCRDIRNDPNRIRSRLTAMRGPVNA